MIILSVIRIITGVCSKPFTWQFASTGVLIVLYLDIWLIFFRKWLNIILVSIFGCFIFIVMKQIYFGETFYHLRVQYLFLFLSILFNLEYTVLKQVAFFQCFIIILFLFFFLIFFLLLFLSLFYPLDIFFGPILFDVSAWNLVVLLLLWLIAIDSFISTFIYLVLFIHLHQFT